LDKDTSNKLLNEVFMAAFPNFPNTKFRIWYTKLSEDAWRGLIFDINTKKKLIVGPIQPTPQKCLIALRKKTEVVSRVAGK